MKNINYTIIDHIGSLESEEIIKTAYKIAYELSSHAFKDTYTIKNFCKKISKNPNTKVSDKQKNFVRFNKHPDEVIIIVNNINRYNQWLIDNWAEKCNNLYIIDCSESSPEVITFKEYKPEWFAEKQATNSIYRRCANIWGNALGWNFSAPLYRDIQGGMNEGFMKRPDHKELINKLGSHITKIASKPESYLKAQAVASEEECKEFFQYYKYLQTNNLLKDFLEAGYYICPECGRPIRESATECDYCNYIAESYIELESYFDDSFEDENYNTFFKGETV